MASAETLRQRPTATAAGDDEPTTTETKTETTTTTPQSTTTTAKSIPREQRAAMAKRGLRSLSVAVVVPTLLTMSVAYLLGSTSGYASVTKPLWRPPRWALHLGSLSTSALMGFASWLVWADGGMRREPAALPLFVTQLLLGSLWAPLVLGLGAMRIGLADCAALLLALLACVRVFRKVNPVASDLVKPCLAWAAFLAVFNYRLLK